MKTMIFIDGNGAYSGLLHGREFGLILVRLPSGNYHASGYLYDQPWETAKGINYMQHLSLIDVALLASKILLEPISVVTTTGEASDGKTGYIIIPDKIRSTDNAILI